MDEQRLQEQEFDLEDIIREFSDSPVTQEVPQTEEPEEYIPEPEESAPVQTQTIPTTVTDATIRLEAIPQTRGQVHNAQPITDEEEEAEAVPQEEEKTEPYSEQWEPEYEQPIAEYVPPRPIVFPRRSRLVELKRKLVSGPEKMYYALSEKGLGKLQLAIIVCALLVLISAAGTVMYAFGLVPENRLRFMVFSQFFVMLVSAFLGSFQLVEGAADLFRGKFSLNTLLCFTFVLCCVDGVLCLQQLRVPCCAAFGLQVTMSLWRAYEKRNTMLGELDTMRKATRLDRVAVVEDYYAETKGLLRDEGQVEQFIDTYDQPARLEKVLSVYAIVALCVSVAVGVTAGVLHGVAAGIQVAAVTTLAAMPASMFVTISRPKAVLERRLHALGAVLCGWQGVEALSGKAVFPVDHEDMFPVATVKMNGVKFFGSRMPDEIIAYATALVAADGSGLEPLFTHLLDSRNGMHYEVEAFQAYDEGGIGGLVNSEPVLAGSLSFLKEMGVDIPEGIRVNQAVCVAIENELCGLFAITYEKDRGAAAGMSTLCSYKSLRPVLTTRDFMADMSFVRSKFGINTKRLVTPSREECAQLREIKPEEDALTGALVTGEGLAPFAYAVTGARMLKSAATLGVVIHMIGGILGIVMMLVLAILGQLQLLTPANMFLYELVWMVPGLLITEWTRNI